MKSDAQLQKDVMEELKWELRVTASEIGVSAANGVVVLSNPGLSRSHDGGLVTKVSG